MAHDRPSRGRALAWALIALVLPRVSAAAAFSMPEPPAPDRGQEPGAPLDLVVNLDAPRPVHARVRGTDVFVPAADLAAAGLKDLPGTHVHVDGREWVSLASLAPALRYELDERALALRVTAGAELLGRASLDLRPTRRPPELEVRGDASGFVNYSVQVRSDRRTSGFAEAGASEGGRLLYASGQLLPDGTAVRGLSSLTVDDVPSLRRLVLGDAFAASRGLGGGLLLGGVSLVREYGLDPYVLRSPMPGLSGFTSTPSVLDVYVNGVLTRQVPLPPGGYDVTNLPVTAGAGNVRTVLRDAFGRTEVLDWRYYYTAGLLARGLSDYGYAVGFRRAEYGRASFAYGRPVFVGRHRVGVGDALTVGGRLDAAEDLASGGPCATLGLPFGSIDLEAAASVQAGRPGVAASAGYGFVSRRLGGGALLRVMSDRYGNASLRASDDRARLQSSVYAGAPIGSRVGVGVDWAVSRLRDAGLSDVVSARTDVLLARGLTLGITASRTRTAGRAPALDVFATLSWAFAPMSMADVSGRAGDGGRSASAGVQRGLPAGTGVGYRARGGSGPAGDAATAVLQAQWDHGRYEVEYDRTASNRTGLATVSGGAVFVGDRFFLSRPVQEGYGLIRVGVPGVRGFAEGQEIGRTDARGDLLVPTLLPYYGNRLAIADRDVPILYGIGPTELVAAPTWRGGVVTRFAVTPLGAVEGQLVTPVHGADVPPAYGELTVRSPGASFSSPVGGDGRFYLEALPSGGHVAEVEWSGGRCRASLSVPEAPGLVDLGTVRCQPELLASAPAREAARAPGPAPSAAPATGSAPAIATLAPVAAPPPPPPKPPRAAPAPRRTGLGPRTRTCPACTVCFLAAIDRAIASRYTLSCARDLALLAPALTLSEAAKACIGAPGYRELCAECAELRSVRKCPPWSGEEPPRAAARGRSRR